MDISCAMRGCQLREAQQILSRAQQLVNENRKATMDANEFRALWCDEGRHAFSPRDKGRKVLVVSGFDTQGDETEETRMACSDHQPKMRQLAAPVVQGTLDETSADN